jgi:hypothetical protein
MPRLTAFGAQQASSRFTTESVEKRAEILPQEDLIVVGREIKPLKKENAEG